MTELCQFDARDTLRSGRGEIFYAAADFAAPGRGMPFYSPGKGKNDRARVVA